ncbi:MAG TPA: hypothetical protein VFI24_28330 [Pyrinomonadaceae bacterium]|nr:hypothetical protein [Pyrinomonadaceae bacterium]
MKGILLTCLCLALLTTGLATGAYGQQQDGPLTNVSIVKLVKAGFKEKTIITIINNRPSNFNLDTEHLIELKRNGVNEDIIVAMLSAQMGTVLLSEDEWSGDPFFKDFKKQSGSESQPQSGGSSIFGSGSSSQSSSRSRGGSGGNQNDSNLSGSATVRIIKPPSEGGESSAPKLEKTPTLTNEGVIKLVEAGFSEGTIIKRIEDSPVDFDLSPAKLDDLFKKRVTDAIIAAMRAAMGK